MDLIRIPGPEMNEMAAKRKGFPSLSETFRDGRNDSLITVAVCKQNSDFYRFSPMLAPFFSFSRFFSFFLSLERFTRCPFFVRTKFGS